MTREIEQTVSDSGLVSFRDFGDGMASTCVGGAGSHCVWTLRLPDGTLGSIHIYEVGERWYGDAVVFTAGRKTIFETATGIGPYNTMAQAASLAGKAVGRMARPHLRKDDFGGGGE
jgi:hypothetical protein